MVDESEIGAYGPFRNHSSPISVDGYIIGFSKWTLNKSLAPLVLLVEFGPAFIICGACLPDLVGILRGK